MCRVDNCCCCFTVQTGVHIIGIMLICRTIAEFRQEDLNIYRWVIMATVSGIYGLTLFNDSKFTRMVFFFAYVIYWWSLTLVDELTNGSDTPEEDKAED